MTVPRGRCNRCFKLDFHGTDTDTDTDTDILVDFRARIVARMSACPATFQFSLPRAGDARRSLSTCPPTCPTRTLLLAKMSVRDARVYTCKPCTVQDKLLCTRLQNYTIGASLKSVSVSVPWNSSFSMLNFVKRRPDPAGEL